MCGTRQFRDAFRGTEKEGKDPCETSSRNGFFLRGVSQGPERRHRTRNLLFILTPLVSYDGFPFQSAADP